MHDDTPHPAMECARPEGSGYRRFDEPLVAEMRELVRTRKATSWARAAWMVVGRAHGTGGEAAKVRRLVQLAKTIYGELSPKSHLNSIMRTRADPPESDSLPPMMSAQTSAERLDARVAFLEARCAEQDLQMAELIGTVTSLIGLQAKGNDIAERQTDALERFAEVAEEKLDELGAPRVN